MANKKREAEVRDRLAAEIKQSGYQAVTEQRIEVNRNARVNRYIDILAAAGNATFIVEVKCCSRYQHAIGQVLSNIMLYGKTIEQRRSIRPAIVMYGTLNEIRVYEPECRLVLDKLEETYGINITLLTEVG